MAVKLPLSCSSPLSSSRLLPRRCFRSQPLPFARNTSLSFRLVSVRAAASPGDGSGSDYRSASLANGAPPSPSPAAATIDFLTLCHRLKTTKRKGWINHGIKGPESIADHMYRMALMALIAGDLPGVNRERCIKIAIVHDMAEAIVGDITPSDGVPKAEKSRLEQEALNEMCEILGGGLRASEIKELWAEYENNSSIEANLVKDFDKNMERFWMNFFFQQQVNFKLTLARVGLLRWYQEETKGYVNRVEQSPRTRLIRIRLQTDSQVFHSRCWR